MSAFATELVTRDEIIMTIVNAVGGNTTTSSDNTALNLNGTNAAELRDALQELVRKKGVEKKTYVRIEIGGGEIATFETVGKIIALVQNKIARCIETNSSPAEQAKMSKHGECLEFLISALKLQNTTEVYATTKFSKLIFNRDTFLDAIRINYKNLPIDGVDALKMLGFGGRNTISKAAEVLANRLLNQGNETWVEKLQNFCTVEIDRTRCKA